MESKKLEKSMGLLLAGALMLTACTHMIKTDMDSYLQNRDEYRKKKIVFTATLKDIVERYELYYNKEVELSAPVTYFGREGFSTWYLTLEKDAQKIRAFEEYYHNCINPQAWELLTRAQREGGEVTVRGKLSKDGIALNQLVYNEYVINTNRRPYRVRSGYRPYFRSYDSYYDSWTNWNYGHSYNYNYSY